jgi:hypothetical protein
MRTASAAQAGGNGGANGGDRANAAPACSDECPVLATEGPGNPGDDNGRSGARMATIQAPAAPVTTLAAAARRYQ